MGAPWWVHLLAVVGLGTACALWVVLQRAGGASPDEAGRCGACANERRASDAGECDGLSGRCDRDRSAADRR